MVLRVRTVVVGFDGLDATLTKALIRAGLLPRIESLSRGGRLCQTRSSTPANSAVAWASFNTAANPARTNIFDTIRRSEGTYAPRPAGFHTSVSAVGPGRLALFAEPAGAAAVIAAGAHLVAQRITRRTWMRRAACVGACAAIASGIGAGIARARWLPTCATRAHTEVVGVPWWDRLAQHGTRSIVLRVPLTFPARAHPSVKLLSEVGVPDIRKAHCRYLILSDAGTTTGARGTFIPIQWQTGCSTVRIPAADPQGVGTSAYANLLLEKESPDAVRLTSGATAAVLGKGAWSDWIPLTFRVSPLVETRAMVRLYFQPRDNQVTLYMTPPQLDPKDPSTANVISAPPDFVTELTESGGRFRTLQRQTQLSALTDGAINDRAYLDDLSSALDNHLRQFREQLARPEWDNLMTVFREISEAQHMFFDDEIVTIRAGGQIRPRHPLVELYQWIDNVVGELDALARTNGWRLVVFSLHGAAPYRRAVNLNTWLADNGWLGLTNHSRKDGCEFGEVTAEGMWHEVDWFNTRAYALGLAGIYLNVAGREPQGLVKRGGEYNYLQEQLAMQLAAWIDPKTNRPIFAAVHRKQDIYRGPFLDAAPDLILSLNEEYRISATSAVGGIPTEQLLDNRSHWNGDSSGVNPAAIPGICLTNFAQNWPNDIPIDRLAPLIWSDAWR